MLCFGRQVCRRGGKMGTQAQTLHIPEPYSFPAVNSATLDLQLKVSDPDVIAELEKHKEGWDREDYALTALRLGSLALRQARGDLDAIAVRETGQKVLHDLESLFQVR